jgi:hypothetical protein
LSCVSIGNTDFKLTQEKDQPANLKRKRSLITTTCRGEDNITYVLKEYSVRAWREFS